MENYLLQKPLYLELFYTTLNLRDIIQGQDEYSLYFTTFTVQMIITKICSCYNWIQFKYGHDTVSNAKHFQTIRRRTVFQGWQFQWNY